MCGCTKVQPRAQTPPVARRALPAVPRGAPIVNKLVTLRYLCDKPERDLADLPTKSHYQVGTNKLIRVYADDVYPLLERQCVDGPAFERLT